MSILARNFNPETLNSLMCRNLVSVGYDGALYDCDFNQQLAMGLKSDRLRSLFDLQTLQELEKVGTSTDNHCFGCTAGQGSS